MYVLSSKGEQNLKNEEGLRLKAYRDAVGLWTIGYGHRCSASLRTITLAQAEALFAADVQRVLEALWKECKTLKQYQVDALVSFIFNIGIHAWIGSTALRDLLDGKIAAVPHEMRRWVHDHSGHVIPGLVARRNREAITFEGKKAA